MSHNFLGGQFYHGTTLANADSILREGAQPDRNSNAVYGRGFYVSPDEDYATSFAWDDEHHPHLQGSALLAGTIHARNPKIYTHEDQAFDEAFSANPTLSQRNALPWLTQHLREQGHDFVQYDDMTALALKPGVFHPKQLLGTKPVRHTDWDKAWTDLG